jgi:glucose-6-phosphate isomerase
MTETSQWKNIQSYYNILKNKRIENLFEKDRIKDFTHELNGIYFDFSKNKIDKKLLNLFSQLAEEMQLEKGIADMFNGEKINTTENRAVLHTALRDFGNQNILVDGVNIREEILKTNKRIKNFTTKIISGEWKGISGKKITDIVNIGIGGSELGPKTVVHALKNYRNRLNIHYLSNIDPFQLDQLLNKIDLETTLFVIVSKSFTTQETLTNAKNIQSLYIKKYGKKSIAKHFATVSTQVEKAQEFGINKENIFPMWDWVGGRFSLWSPAGISIPLAIGFENYERLLKGAYEMDEHFKKEKFSKNIPFTGAIISIIYNNLFGYSSEAYIPYAEKLKYLPDFLQQLLMESNGKYIDRDGKKVNYETGNILWGNPGTNAQHSFFQLLHQGTKIIPVHFIAEKTNNKTNFPEQHQMLLSNMIAQSEALMKGETHENPYKNFEGDRPSTTILIDEINPESIGSLLAYYEHITFVEGYLWNINSFDQFGVELGKKMATNILKSLKDKKIGREHDESTKQLLQKLINSY